MRRLPPTPLKKGRSPANRRTMKKERGTSSNTLGWTPAHCDASRISAGVQFISSAAARPNHAKHIQNLSIPCSKGSKPFQIAPQSLPKPSQNLSRATQNPSKRPLVGHLGPMLLQDMILKDQKSVKMRPKVTTRLPRASQTLPKLSPTPSKIRFLGAFLRIFF